MGNYRHVYQPTPFACMAAVAAMITGDCIDEVFDFIGHECRDRHASFLDVARYLNTRGYHLGGYCTSCPTKSRKAASMWALALPALVIVESRTGHDHTHAVLWTGGKVLDPHPVCQGRGLDDYVVIEWWPLIRFEG